MKNNRLIITYGRSIRLPLNQKIVDVYRVKTIQRAHDIIHRGARKVKSAMFKDGNGKEFNLSDIEFHNYQK